MRRSRPPAGAGTEVVGSLRRQIVVATFLLGTLIAVALVAVVAVVIEGNAGSAVSRVLDERAAAVVDAAATATTEASDLRVPDTALDPGVAVYDASGRLVAGSAPPSQSEAFASLAATSGTSGLTVQDAYRLHARSFTTPAGAAGVVVLSEPLAPYEDVEHDALAVSVAAGVLIVLLATALAAWASRRALAPVTAMAATAETWSEHDLQRRFDLGAPTNEIRALGRTLDGLLARVAGAILAEQRLTSELAHELRTPLTAIKTTADLLAMRSDLDDELRRDVADIQESCRVMATTISSLLELARAQRTDLATPGIDGACDLRAVLDDVRLHLEHPGRLTLADDVAGVTLAMPHALAVRAVTPVVQNAVHHADVVRVTVRVTGGTAQVAVVDDGPGVPAAEAGRIFDPGATSGDGAGLGLPLARRVARSVGGDVVLGSTTGAETLGGAEFVVSLPARESKGDPANT